MGRIGIYIMALKNRYFWVFKGFLYISNSFEGKWIKASLSEVTGTFTIPPLQDLAGKTNLEGS